MAPLCARTAFDRVTRTVVMAAARQASSCSAGWRFRHPEAHRLSEQRPGRLRRSPVAPPLLGIIAQHELPERQVRSAAHAVRLIFRDTVPDGYITRARLGVVENLAHAVQEGHNRRAKPPPERRHRAPARHTRKGGSHARCTHPPVLLFERRGPYRRRCRFGRYGSASRYPRGHPSLPRAFVFSHQADRDLAGRDPALPFSRSVTVSRDFGVPGTFSLPSSGRYGKSRRLAGHPHASDWQRAP